MFNLPLCAILCVLVNTVTCNFNGPFLFWGLNGLKTYRLSALEELDDKTLQDMYTDATAVILFLRNATNRLSADSYPTFKGIIDKSEWVYLPQHVLSSDPVDYNLNAEVIHLVGPISQQDLEMSALFRDSELNYGKGKVLGILAAKWDGHKLFKRETADEEKEQLSSTLPPPTAATTLSPASSTPPPDDDKYDEDYIYYKEKAACLYTTSPPILQKITETENGNSTSRTTETLELKLHSYVGIDEREGLNRLIVTFKHPNDTTKIIMRFRFPITKGYWSLTSVEVQVNTVINLLTVEGEAPSAPIGFSYHCSAKPIVFRNENRTELVTFENIQVEPKMNKKGFNDAYDCIGFTTAPIWSGILVSFIMLGGLSIAICAILDIKPPNRFENSRNKQLTFTVQE